MVLHLLRSTYLRTAAHFVKSPAIAYHLTFLTAFLFGFSCLSFGQIYSVQNYSVDRGIATRTVYDATQDGNGVMWFATAFGISSYDGFRFTNYEFKRDVHKVAFRKAVTDEKGYVWCVPLSTLDTIRVIREGVWSNVPPPDEQFVYGLNTSFALKYESGEPVLCVGTMKGVYVYRNGVWKNYSAETGLLSPELLCVTAFENKFYSGTWKGLSVFDGEKFDNSLDDLIPELRDGVLKVVFRKGGADGTVPRMWVLQRKRLGYVENGVYTVVTSDFELPYYDMKESYSMAFDKHENVYFGCLLAKFYLNSTTGRVEPLLKANGFVSDGCTSIYVDREENVWVPDWKGLAKINSFAFRNHSSLNGLAEEEVTAINEISPKVYIFGHSQGYTVMENKKMKYFPFESKTKLGGSNYRILDLHKDLNGSLWMAVYNKGIARFDGTDKPVWLKTPDSVTFSSVVTDDKGRVFASSYKGLFILKNGRFELFENKVTKNLIIRKIFNLKDGKVWAASPMGVYAIDDDSAKNFRYKNSIPFSNSYSVFKDSRQRVLVGTEMGLYMCKGDSLVKFNDNGFEIEEAVYSMVQDKNNNYWFATNKNLVFWDGVKVRRVYNSRNGLIPGVINRSALYCDLSDKLWIGTEFGVSRYIPELDNNSNVVPQAEILGIQQNGNKIIKVNNDVSFSSGNNDLKFMFRAVSFVDENSIQYGVKLDGYDKDWVYFEERDLDDVVYRNLPAGDYVLRVKAKNLSGDWGKEAVSKVITIERVLYLKWWFDLLAVLFLTGSVWGIIHYRNKRVYTSKLEAEVKKRTEELTKVKDDLTKVNTYLEDRVDARTKELAESESKFRSVVEQASDGIVIYDMQSKEVLLTNKAYEKMLGYEKDEFKGLTLYDIVNHEKESVDLFVDKIDKEGLILIGERLHRMKNGKLLEVEVTVSKISYGGKTAMCVVVRDITERKKVMNDLKKLADDQKELIAEKDKFFSIMAHDLRNPFMGLLGFTELMKNDINSLSKEELTEFSENIHNSAKSVFDLLNNLLQWGRLQTGKTEMLMVKIDLTKRVSKAIDLLRNNSLNKEIEVVNEVNGVYDVYADSFMVDSILQNVLTNAIKFTPRNGRIRFGAEMKDGLVVISVEDTGTGIAKDKLENIYRLDERVSTPGTENEPGTGLGVVLCREMAEKMGGSFEIQSEKGKGTTVKVGMKKFES